MPVVPVLADLRTFLVKFVVNCRMTIRTFILWPCLDKTSNFLTILGLVTSVGLSGRKLGPEHTRSLLEIYVKTLIYIYILFNDELYLSRINAS